MEDNKNIELRSEEVQDVLGAVPPRILRRGITVLFLVVVMLLVGSWFFKYPDVISSSMTLTSNTPPAGITAKVGGKLTGCMSGINRPSKKETVWQSSKIRHPSKTSRY
ncbi:MAG: hypothetical protein FWF54_07735 [Candidatus Azobacteroides sp.]|nr:hypothetical protein [Candidatus Azobacteroides sp.]